MRRRSFKRTIKIKEKIIMALNRYEQILRVLRDNRGCFLTAREIYDMVVANNPKKNGLKSPASVWQILRRYDSIDKIKTKNNVTMYRIPD
jgi:hypothetical protein